MQHVNNLIVFVFLSSSEGKAALVFLSSVLYKTVGEQCILFHSIVEIAFEMNPCVSFLIVVFILFQMIFSIFSNFGG